MTYYEKLRDPRWQKLRLEIFQRDDFKCQHCSDGGEELQVHHKVYHRGAEPWEYNQDELVTMCKPCHEKITDLKREIGAVLHFEPNYKAFSDLLVIIKSNDWAEVCTIVRACLLVSGFQEEVYTIARIALDKDDKKGGGDVP